MDVIDAILKRLANYGIYINKSRVNMIQEISEKDLYIIFFDNYKVHVRLDPEHDKAKVNVYRVIWRNKKSDKTS